MLDSLGVMTGLLLLSFGVGLVYESVSNVATAAVPLLAGAALSALGALTLFLIARSRWRRARFFANDTAEAVGKTARH